MTAALLRAYAELAGEVAESGYSQSEVEAIKNEVTFYENLRNEIKLHSGDAIDLKQYEPAMRHLIDTYIRAEDSTRTSAFDDMSLVELIVERGVDALNALPEGIRENKEAAAETIENNVRKLILDESPINPKYYEKMSELLDALIKQRREDAIKYEEYLRRIVELTKQVKNPATGAKYSPILSTPGLRALYDNLKEDEAVALSVHRAVGLKAQDGWRGNRFKLIPPYLEKWQSTIGVKVAECSVRKMKTKWGSCNAEAGRIWLNLELAKKPPQCLEYIIVHEMVHLLERHHNDRFNGLMDQCLPNWRLLRAELNSAPLAHETWSY